MKYIIPFAITGLDFDNGSEFLNAAVISWAGERGIYFTRSRPYKKNDQATIESKNNHLVRRYGFYYRYDTAAERAVGGERGVWAGVGRDQAVPHLDVISCPVGGGTSFRSAIRAAIPGRRHP